MDLLQQLAFQGLNGLIWGLILALMALGLNLIYGVLGIINVAHGAFYMLGGVLTWYLWYLAPWGFWWGLLLAPALVGLLGLLLERGVLRPVEGRPVMTIIVTFGLLLLLQHGVLLLFGGAPRSLPEPVRFTVGFLGLHYPGYRLVVALLSVVAMAALWLLLHRSRLGLWIRATAQSRELATALGLPVPWIYLLTFGLGAALAALAGALTAPLVSVSYRMGEEVLIEAFIVVIVGGLGSLGGAALAGMLLGVLEGLFTVWASPVLARVLALAALGGALLLRPEGLLGKRSGSGEEAR